MMTAEDRVRLRDEAKMAALIASPCPECGGRVDSLSVIVVEQDEDRVDTVALPCEHLVQPGCNVDAFGTPQWNLVRATS